MELTWIGHSCFRLRGKDASLITDPCAPSAGYPLNRVSADIVTISNDHPHHSAASEVTGDPTVLDGPGEYEVRGVTVTGVRTPKPNAEAPRNTAYIVTIDDVTVCHLGDILSIPAIEQVELMKDVNVLLIPVGGHCTIGPSEAVEVISRIEPKLVIPMHYATDATTVEPLEVVDRFLREMGITQTEPQPRLNVTHSSLPSEPTVVLLQYRRP